MTPRKKSVTLMRRDVLADVNAIRLGFRAWRDAMFDNRVNITGVRESWCTWAIMIRLWSSGLISFSVTQSLGDPSP